MRKLTREEYPEWIKDSVIKDEDIWLNDNGNIIWKSGIWEWGIWEKGIWKSGIWKDGFKLFIGLTIYEIYYSKKEIKIGCQTKSIEEWDRIIKEEPYYYKKYMNENQYKEMLKAIEIIKYINSKEI